MKTSRLLIAGSTIVILAPLGILVAGRGPESLNAGRVLARGRLVAQLKEATGERADQPKEALEFYWTKRSPTGEALAVSPLQAAAAAADALPLYSTRTRQTEPGGTHAPTIPLTPVTAAGSASGAFASAWQPLGPGNIGGRTRALLIHRTQNNLMWTAGVAGGIWKSADAGASWQPKGDLLVNIAVNSIIEDAKDPSVLYAGTGEGYFNGDGVRGQGIFKSRDYGETWAQLPATNTSDFFYVQKLAATAQKNKQRIYAATRTGIFRSSDDGATWTKVLDATAVNGCMDIVMQYDSEAADGYVFASCGTFAQATVWRAPDSDRGQVWQPVLREPNMGRTSLAVAASNPNVVYAMASFYDVAQANPQDYALLAIYRSRQAGAPGSWETRVSYTDPNPINAVQLTNPVYAFLHDCGFGPANLPIYTQGWYDNQIAVDPTNENIVWSAGIDLMRSDDGGKTWGVGSYWWFDQSDPDYAHADNHVITFHPKYNGASNRQMFVGSDGGVFRTDNARAAVGKTLTSICGSPARNEVHWTPLNNGYQVTQFYHGTVYPDGATYFGGAQDNGTVRGNTAGGQYWQTISGGDGGYVAVDRDDTNVLYSEFTGKSLQRSVDGGALWTDIYGGVTEAGGNFLFIEPFAMDPTNPQRLWYGGAFAWRSDDRGNHWRPVSQFLSARIASWAVAPADPNRVYLGVQHIGTTTSGRIFTTTAGTTATSQVTWPSAQPRQGYVSAIAVDPVVPTTAYATYSTYNFGTNVGHVFKTADGGATWTRIDAGLPDLPVNTIAVHPTQPDTLYIGTDLGVFVTLDGGASWMRENTGFANVVVDHLEVNGGRLFAFTHGRSTWSVPLTD
jgi:photosystem II stability/assembly factor-like uncharacterized protein